MRAKKKEKGPAQAYLEKIRKLDVRISCLLEEKKQLEDMALRVTPSMSGSGGSSGGNHDKLGNAVCRIADKKDEIDRMLDELVDLKDEASTLLARLDNPAHLKVLHDRYFQYKSFESIAVEMGYTYRNIHYLHGRALQALGNVLEEHRNRITINMDARVIEQAEIDEAIRKTIEDSRKRIRRAAYMET